MISDEELQAIEQYMRDATAGPWEFETGAAKRAAWQLQQRGGRIIFYLDPTKNVKLDESTRQVGLDMEFIERSREDFSRVLAELSFARRTIRELRETFDRQTEEWSALYQENLRLKEALEFYGNPRTYRRTSEAESGAVTPAPIEKDYGHAARVLLGLVPPEPPPQKG